MTTCLGKGAFRKLLSVYIFSYFPFGFEGRMWDLIVSVPDYCLSFYVLLRVHAGQQEQVTVHFHLMKIS